MAGIQSSRSMECVASNCGGEYTCTSTNRSSGVMFNSATSDFEFSVCRVSGVSTIMVGIVLAGTDLQQPGLNLYGRPGFFLYLANSSLHSESNRGIDSGLPDTEIPIGKTVKLRLGLEPRVCLFATLEGESEKALEFPSIPKANYRPCVIMDNGSTVVRVSLAPTLDPPCPHKRRKVMQHDMYGDTAFTDCRVRCGDRVFQCHRVVLSAASPVFLAAFAGRFREGQDAALNIDDADPTTVEAVLKYAYTSEFDGKDALSVLKLAHQYEFRDLVAECVAQLVNQVTVENVVQIVSAMNTFLENPEVALVWPRLLKKVCEDTNLRDAAMRSVRA